MSDELFSAHEERIQRLESEGLDTGSGITKCSIQIEHLSDILASSMERVERQLAVLNSSVASISDIQQNQNHKIAELKVKQEELANRWSWIRKYGTMAGIGVAAVVGERFVVGLITFLSNHWH